MLFEPLMEWCRLVGHVTDWIFFVVVFFPRRMGQQRDEPYGLSSNFWICQSSIFLWVLVGLFWLGFGLFTALFLAETLFLWRV